MFEEGAMNISELTDKQLMECYSRLQTDYAVAAHRGNEKVIEELSSWIDLYNEEMIMRGELN